MTTTITLDSLVFPQSATSGWLFNNLIDWYALSDDKSPVIDRPQKHGAFEVDASWRSPAAVSFQAVYLADTYAELLAAQENLTATGATGPVRMTVADDLRATSRFVTVKSTHVPDSHNEKALQYSVDCLARDPLRYGDPISVTTGLATAGTGLIFPLDFPVDFGTPGDQGRVALINLGNAPTAPRFIVTGPVSSFTLKEISTGKQITFDRAIPPGSSVEIDMRTRRAIIDGQSDVSSFLSSREWWEVPPKTTSLVQFSATGVSGTPTLTGVIESAWW